MFGCCYDWPHLPRDMKFKFCPQKYGTLSILLNRPLSKICNNVFRGWSTFTCTKSNQRQKGKGGSHLVVLMPLSVSYYSTQWFLSLGLMLIFDMILFTSSRTMNMGGDLLEKPTTEVEDSGSYWPGNPALPPPPAPRNTFLNSQVRSLMSLSLSNSVQPPTSSSLSSDQKKLSQQRRRSSSVPPTSESSGSWPSGIGER